MPQAQKKTAHLRDYIHLTLPGPVYEYREPKGKAMPEWMLKQDQPLRGQKTKLKEEDHDEG